MARQAKIVFGPFSLEVADERLFRGKEPLHLHPKAFAVLRWLVEHPGELVRRQTLLENVWAGLYVSDAVLTESVKEIRKALADDAKQPQFVDTVHRRGYRFIAPIEGDFADVEGAGARSSAKRASFEICTQDASTIGALPLVGRETECRFLYERVDAALRGTGSLVFVTGPPGIGKTRLAMEVRDYAQRKGCDWLEGKYDAITQPYKAWTNIVGSYLRRHEGTSFDRLAGPYSHDLAKLVPDVDRLESSIDATEEDPDTERYRLFESVTNFLIHVSVTAPLVLFLDDLQWAPSVELVHYLTRKIGNQRILTLAAYRDEELQSNPALHSTVLEMHRQRLFHPLPLKPLGEDQVGQLISQRVEGQVDAQLAKMVYQRTKGNPFFIEEMAHFFLEQQALVESDAGWILKESARRQTPGSIKAVIDNQVARLGEDAGKLLRIACVAGRQFSLPLLQELSGESEETVIEMIDRCEKASLVVPQEVPGEEIYNFDHDLVHEALYDGIGSAQRRRLHRRIGEAVEKVYASSLSDHYDALAHHFLQGNVLTKALQYALEAGKRAEKASSWELAAGHFKTAIRLLKKLPEDLRREAEILEQIISLETLLGRPGLAYADRMLELYTRLEDRRKAAHVHHLFAMSWTSGTAGDASFGRAQRHRRTAVRLLDTEPDSVEKAVARAQLSYGFYYALDLERALQQGQAALGLAKRLGDSEALTEAMEAVALSLMALGRLVEAERYFEEAWDACRKGGDPRLTARTAIVPVMMAPWRHDRLWLERWIERSLAYHKPSRVLRYELSLHSLSGLLCALTCRPAEAVEALSRAEQAASRRPYFTPFMLRFAGAIHATTGNWERADELLSTASRSAEKGRFSFYIAETSGYYAEFLLTKGDWRHAAKVLAKAIKLVRERRSVVQEVKLLTLQCELLVRTSRPDRLKPAERVLQRAYGVLTHEQPWNGLRAGVTRVEGILAAAQDDWPRAEEAFRSAHRLERRCGFRYDEARVLFEWGQMYLKRHERSDGTRAEELFRHALELYESCHAKPDIDRVQAALASV